MSAEGGRVGTVPQLLPAGFSCPTPQGNCPGHLSLAPSLICSLSVVPAALSVWRRLTRPYFVPFMQGPLQCGKAVQGEEEWAGAGR